MAFPMGGRRSPFSRQRTAEEAGAAEMAAGSLLRSIARQAIIAAAADAVGDLDGRRGSLYFPYSIDPRSGRPGGPGGEDEPDGNQGKGESGGGG